MQTARLKTDKLAGPLLGVGAPAAGSGPLDGWTVAVKDLLDVRGLMTAAGGSAGYRASADATVVARLRRAGAGVAGKAHMDEWGLGVSGRNRFLGRCPNPWDVLRLSGGSSSGSVVAVATGRATIGIGTDSAGSLRIPAALCGVTALKPTRGRLPMGGVVGLASTLDCVGPIARSAQDCATAFEVMNGGHAPRRSRATLRIGLPRDDHWLARVEPAVGAAVQEAAGVFARQGAQLITVGVPSIEEATRLNGVVLLYELSHEHEARWAGRNDLDARVARQLELGRAIERHEDEAALAFRLRWRRRLGELFEQVDALLHPTVPCTAPLASEYVATAELTRLTAAWNLGGLPVLNLPVGFDERGLPIGASLVGPDGSELALLGLGAEYQRVANWHTATGRIMRAQASIERRTG